MNFILRVNKGGLYLFQKNTFATIYIKDKIYKENSTTDIHGIEENHAVIKVLRFYGIDAIYNNTHTEKVEVCNSKNLSSLYISHSVCQNVKFSNNRQN